MAKAKTQRPKSKAKTWTDVRRLAKALPGAEESASYGTPAFKVKKKLMVRLHQSGEALVVMISMSDRELRMKVDPVTFFITDHYLNYPAMLVRLSTVQEADLRELLEEAWRRVAPASLIKQNQSP